MKVTKAIIPVAGWGTRRLPITKAIEKCMLPIGNRPTLDYIVQDCMRAGATDIYFVVSPWSDQVKQYYSSNEKLEQYLESSGKSDKIHLITPPNAVNFHFTTQEIQNGSLSAYGKAIDEFDIDEPVIFSSGDDIIWRADGGSDLANLVESLPEEESGMLAAEVDPAEIGRYGALDVEDGYLAGIIEKPSPEVTTSNLINVVKWVLKPEIVRAIRRDYLTSDYPADRETHYLKALLATITQGHKLRVQKISGDFLDTGTVEGWLNANNVICGDLPK